MRKSLNEQMLSQSSQQYWTEDGNILAMSLECPNKNAKTGVVLETMWKKEKRTSKRNVPTNHHKKGTTWNLRMTKLWGHEHRHDDTYFLRGSRRHTADLSHGRPVFSCCRMMLPPGTSAVSQRHVAETNQEYFS